MHPCAAVREAALRRSPRRLVLTCSSLALVLGCHRVDSGVDVIALGYGPGNAASLASGYEPDPVPRHAPTPWTPPDRDARPVPSLGLGELESEPVPYTDDVVRVCEHLAGLDGAAPEADCLRRRRIARVFRTVGDWKTLVACIEVATDAEGLAACERATPPGFEIGDDYPREAGVCMHVFALTIVEQFGPQPMLDAPQLAEFEVLLRECVDTLVVEQRAERNPTEYVEMLDCIEAARTTDAAEACE